jgi:hypothetical protein
VCCNACTLGLGKGSLHESGDAGGRNCKSPGKNFVLEYCLALYRSPADRLTKHVRLVEEMESFAYWKTKARHPTQAQLQDYVAWLYKPVAAESKLSKAVVLLLLDNWSAGWDSELKRSAMTLLNCGQIE